MLLIIFLVRVSRFYDIIRESSKDANISQNIRRKKCTFMLLNANSYVDMSSWHIIDYTILIVQLQQTSENLFRSVNQNTPSW